jgi:ABC-type branched-subunit amino acid transport system ATPase component
MTVDHHSDTSEPSAQGLVARDLEVRFGSVKAVAGLSLEAPLGRVTGLIGPNGAGKTTTFNALCGLVPLAGGRVELFGDDITVWPPATRARAGLGRTFQRVELFDSLSVRENIAISREARHAGARPLRHMFATRAELARIGEAVSEALELCELTTIADREVGQLTTGQRRLVELARAVAGDYRLLLLDEPSSSLEHHETAHLGRVVRYLVDQRGIGALLVEHDMSLVMGICQYLYVLDFGLPIFEGTGPEVAASDIVRLAYLGTEFEAAS